MARARDGTELHIEGPIMHHAIPRSTEKGGKLGESRGPGARDREYLPECVLAWTDWVQTSLTGESLRASSRPSSANDAPGHTSANDAPGHTSANDALAIVWAGRLVCRAGD
jgi:hypothetical protein